MTILRKLRRDESAATVIEFAFALPILVVMLFMVYQLGLIYRANSGIQHSLGQGARAATLYPTPTTDAVKTIMTDSVYGIGPGTFTISEPTKYTDPDSKQITYWDLNVTYSQPTSLIMFAGPTISITKSKRVWVAN